jgi:hypothetical protein
LPDIEVLVPHDDGLEDLAGLRAAFPDVRFVAAPGRRTPAELRSLGVSRARGAIVAITEDHCTPDPDWCRNIVEAHASPPAAIGGAVEKAWQAGTATDSVLSWALYLADWGRYMLPAAEGAVRSLTDCNVTYKRDLLSAVADVWAEEFHEPAVHWALQARGETLWLSPSIVVRQHRELSLAKALDERYRFGRLFAATRVSARTPLARALYVGTACLLPALLVARAGANVLRKRRFLGRFVRALPALVLLGAAWTYGELMGYLTGRPEDSLRPAGVHPGPSAAASQGTSG